MFHSTLENLKSDEFACRFSFISNPRAVHRALQRSEDVKKLRSALGSGEVTERSLREFCADLLRDLKYGSRFPHEFAIAAMAVAIENWPTPFADEFITDLGKLELRELPIAIRVAREARREFLRLPGNKTKMVAFAGEGNIITEWQTVSNVHRVLVDKSEEVFALEAS